MEQQPCDPSRQNSVQCPVFARQGVCYTDNHHLQFPRRDAHRGAERNQRNDPNYQVDVCRALHNAIHASGYQPEIPNQRTGDDEAIIQLATGQVALENYLSRINK